MQFSAEFPRGRRCWVLTGKRILLIIGGGIAAYKSLELSRLLRRRGASVRAILTKAGQEFVTPLSVGGLTHDKVYTDLFDLTAEADMGHIQLSRDADLLVVCPATADLMAKMAQGRADDLASTALLATDKPVMIVPAMNVRMWLHPATQRNLTQLQADGVTVVGPREGDMACGEFGPGRLVEPDEIVEAIEAQFSGRALLAGRKAIVTAGPTHEPIDPVRYIANRSSGKQGYAIAEALARLGAETHLVSGPTSLPDPAGVRVTRIETAREMLVATEAALPADIAICCAAVADWRAGTSTNSKLKKDGSGQIPPLGLVENPDILATISVAGPKRPRLVVGFAAETDDVIGYATAKRQRKGCDWIVANDVSPGTGIMGGDDNTVHLITAGDPEHWDPMPKAQVAMKLAERVADALTGKQ